MPSQGVVLDHDSGNLRSVQRATEHIGAEVALTTDPRTALQATPASGIETTEGQGEQPGAVELLHARRPIGSTPCLDRGRYVHAHFTDAPNRM